ncbi:MAG: alternate F1F0 ATPase, F1 subunit alpha [Vicinamibacterales bacterium]|nr:alternate F1F0 ATPase, F1 subunit alpha [Vicinamibacterales bacterium]
MAKPPGHLQTELGGTLDRMARVVDAHRPHLTVREVGTVLSVGPGIARLSGLPGVSAEELVEFRGGLLGQAFNLDEHEVGVILLGDSRSLAAGDEARRTGRVTDVPVGHALIGRVIDPTGRPRDRKGPLQAPLRWPIEREARAIMDRAPVSVPLETGLKVVDALVPIGRGQRELILGDRQTGKSAIALDTILHQRGKDVICVYCAIGQRSAAVAHFLNELERHDALAYSIVVVASGDESPGLQFIAPYAATSIAEFFMEEGRDVLIVYDDLTRHAQAYRELSLLLRRPPGREAYPGDIFYIHSRLLERATHLKPEFGGGSMTALPIIETEAQNLSAYIPTNLISITDGQIYLSPDLFQKGVLPAVHVGLSVSRVGGKTQLPAYRSVAGELRLSYSQFEELEAFARFGTRLDEDTRRTLARGQRVREVLKQPQYATLTAAEQVVTLLAMTGGLFDGVALDRIAEAEALVREAVGAELAEIGRAIERGDPLTEAQLDAVREACLARLAPVTGEPGHADA